MDIIDIFFYSFLFVFGTAVGSFINAFEYRLKRGIDFVKKRSMCPSCEHELGALDLIPILSFMAIKGRCRYCETKVSWQYPIVEFLAGMLFLLSGWYVSPALRTYGDFSFVWMVCIAVMVGLVFNLFLFFALYDVKHQIVPNRVVIPAIVGVFFLNVIFTVGMQRTQNSPFFDIWPSISISWNVLSGLVGGGFIASIILLTRGKGMGGGDLKLVVLMGLLLGPKGLFVAMYSAVILGSVAGVLWGLKKGKIKGLKVPFALFLSIGTIVAFIWGERIISYYLVWV